MCVAFRCAALICCALFCFDFDFTVLYIVLSCVALLHLAVICFAFALRVHCYVLLLSCSLLYSSLLCFVLRCVALRCATLRRRPCSLTIFSPMSTQRARGAQRVWRGIRGLSSATRGALRGDVAGSPPSLENNHAYAPWVCEASGTRQAEQSRPKMSSEAQSRRRAIVQPASSKVSEDTRSRGTARFLWLLKRAKIPSQGSAQAKCPRGRR